MVRTICWDLCENKGQCGQGENSCYYHKTDVIISDIIYRLLYKEEIDYEKIWILALEGETEEVRKGSSEQWNCKKMK